MGSNHEMLGWPSVVVFLNNVYRIFIVLKEEVNSTLFKTNVVWNAIDLRWGHLAELSPAAITEDTNGVVDGACGALMVPTISAEGADATSTGK